MENKTYLIPKWPAPANVKAYSTTRHMGNLGTKLGDDLDKVTANRLRLMSELNLPNPPVWLDQVHGDKAIYLSETINDEPSADAVYTRTSNVVCTIKTGDCLPILICNQQGTEIAAIHAGWRGLLQGVIDSTIKSLNSPPSQLMAWLGPAIGPLNFELNEQIRVDFLTSNPQNSECFTCIGDDRWFADIYQLAKINLRRYGITQFYGGDHCTYAESDLFYSHRREKETAGRMASLIWFK